MRKIMLTVVACCAVVAFVPASALAHGHKRHHHAARVHHRKFGHDWSQSGSTSGSTSSESPAGTIQSFNSSAGVLTIALADGSTVSGKVTPDTEIECQASDQSTAMRSHDQGGDSGGNDQGDDNGPGDDDQGQGDDDNNQGANQACDASTLSSTPAPMVQEAVLTISSAGAVWKKIELVTASSTTSQSSRGEDS